MNYNRGDIVIVAFPFLLTGGQTVKKARPALVLSDMTLDRRYGDLILAGITSRIPRHPKETEMVVKATPRNGLAKDSTIRLEFLMTIPLELVSRKIGILASSQMALMDLKLIRSLGLPS